MMKQIVSTLLRACGISAVNNEINEGYAASNSENKTLSSKEFQSLAEQGNAEAQYKLGLMYDKGQGVQQDYAQAVSWWRKAADQGHAEAQADLGRLYQNGQGVPMDYVLAVSWWRKAAKQGNAAAHFFLGAAYYHGWGVPSDEVQAMSWFHKSANRGFDGYYHLAGGYENGEGVPQDLVIAYALYNISAAGFKNAAEDRDRLSSQLTRKQIADGQALSREMGKPNNFSKAITEFLRK